MSTRTRQSNASATFKQAPASFTNCAERWPSERRIFRCSIVKRFAQLTTESSNNPAAWPSGLAAEINNWVASPARPVRLVIMATTVFVNRRLSRSFWTTSAGRTFARPPPENGKSTRTTSPRTGLMTTFADRAHRKHPWRDHPNLLSQRLHQWIDTLRERRSVRQTALECGRINRHEPARMASGSKDRQR